jgi:hypothetical protein
MPITQNPTEPQFLIDFAKQLVKTGLFFISNPDGTPCKRTIIEIMNNKAMQNLMDAKCRWRSDRLDGAVSFREPLGQTKVMQSRQGGTLNHQGAITHEVCSLLA